MFANELLLQNGHGAERQYRVEKADAGSVGVKEVTANGRSLEWQTDGNFIVFSCKIPSGAEVLIRVRYTPLETTNGRRKGALSDFVQTAARRYLSEFRDNFLSRHDRLMAIAQKAKRMVSLRAFLNGEAIITMTAEAAAGLPASGGSRYDGESKQSRLSYALITPARNEALFIENTIRSVIAQTVRPRRWIIVSDGSTDGTDETVQRYVSQHGWIELLRMPERRDRQFAAKAHAFNAGYALLKDLEFDIIGNLDADITFDRDYLSFLLSKFQLSPELGVAGTPFVEDHDRLNHHSYAHQFAQLEHVSGACQMFRKECFEEVGGYVPVKAGAVDWIAVTAARMKGWRTRTFTEKVCFHHRKLGVGSGSHGKLRVRFHYGRKAYYVGGHPLWECLRGLFQVREKPFVLGGVWFIAGYVWAALHRSERTVSHELMHFHRAEQMARLRQIFSRLAGNRGRI
jgi:glycosyltransferase involved in cell wall biosynthesis